MGSLKLQTTGVKSGTWEGILSGVNPEDVPKLVVTLHDQTVGELEPTPLDGSDDFHVSFAIPAEQLNEGVQTYLFVHPDTKETLAHFSVVAGEVLADDLRAEIDLLRAELDMFKRVFRQHCIETT